jgi:hypothetical protein
MGNRVAGLTTSLIHVLAKRRGDGDSGQPLRAEDPNTGLSEHLHSPERRKCLTASAVNCFLTELAADDGAPLVWIRVACRQIDAAPKMKPERADFEINQCDFIASEKAWPDMEQHCFSTLTFPFPARIPLTLDSEPSRPG